MPDPAQTEEILEPDLPICDAHHHRWSVPGDRYMLEELLEDTFGGGHKGESTVFVECGAFYRNGAAPGWEFVGEVEFGRLGLDGTALVPLGGALIKHRHRISASGSAVATLVMGRDGRLLADPQVTLHGLVDPEGDGAALGDAGAAVRSAVEALDPGRRADDAAVKEAARLAVRRYIHGERGKKPLTDVHLVRV